MGKKRPILWIIIILTVLASIIDLPKGFNLKFQIGNLKINRTVNGPDIDIKIGDKRIFREINIKEGLDLQGGTHLTLQADMTGIDPKDRDKALESAKDIIERRVNFYGVSEPLIQSSKVGQDYRIIIELPGVKDVNQAIDTIGKTARLEFREFKEASIAATTYPSLENTNQTSITGKDLKRADAEFNQQTGEPIVSFTMTDEGAKKFEELTKRLSPQKPGDQGQPLAIFLDDTPISWPRVQAVISKNGQISGSFTVEQTKNLALQLNAGALPIPIKIVQQQNIGATLGSESVKRSLIAGLIGLTTVAVFMLLNYGARGLLADIALIIYSLLTLALFKFIPITLTMAGIAGFILSIGMAVDANILIFERMKEEIRWGKTKKVALELGFQRAWTSIRDSNVSSLITCTILYWFGTGMIRGFALTLAIGILVSLFSAITITRTFLRLTQQTN